MLLGLTRSTAEIAHRHRLGRGACRSEARACPAFTRPAVRPATASAASAGTPSATASAAMPSEPQAGRLRICLARADEHFDAVSRVWAEALLLPGLTELPAPAGEDELRRLTTQVAQRLRQSYDRKRKAAAESRALRRRGEALLHQLRRGSLTGLEHQLAMRQLDAVRRELRRARRRRLWACLVAWQGPTPCRDRGADADDYRGSGGGGSDGGGDGDGDGDGGGGASLQGHEEGLGERDQSPHGHPPRPPQSQQQRQQQPRDAPAQVPFPAAAAAATSARYRSGGGAANAAAAAATTSGGAAVGSSAHNSISGGSGGGGGSSWSVAGYVLVSISYPLAVLPPPLPSRTPAQLHVDALAVAPGYRRRGVGSELLVAAERLAARWGGSSLWLHVDSCNEAAVQLYSDRGYGIARVNSPGLLAGLLPVPLVPVPAPQLWLPFGLFSRREEPKVALAPPPPPPHLPQPPQPPQQHLNQQRWLRNPDPDSARHPGEVQRLGNQRRGKEEEEEQAGRLEQWRRQQRSRKFVMRKRLEPPQQQRHPTQQQQQREQQPQQPPQEQQQQQEQQQVQQQEQGMQLSRRAGAYKWR